MLDLLFPEVLSKLMYLLRAEQGEEVKGFLDGSDCILVVLTCWGREGMGELWEGGDVQQFRVLCLVFLQLKHHPSFMHFTCLTRVSLDKVMASTSMALGL